MAATLVHIGTDQCARLLVLQHAGYAVESCGTSLAKLARQLRREDVVAVAVTEDGPLICDDVIAIARKATPAPLILFAGVDNRCDPSGFDLVIQPGTTVERWLERVRESIEKSRAIREQSLTLRARALELRESMEKTYRETAEVIADLQKKTRPK